VRKEIKDAQARLTAAHSSGGGLPVAAPRPMTAAPPPAVVAVPPAVARVAVAPAAAAAAVATMSAPSMHSSGSWSPGVSLAPTVTASSPGDPNGVGNQIVALQKEIATLQLGKNRSYHNSARACLPSLG